MSSTNINDTFFKGFYKDVWRTLIPAGLTEAETAFIEEACGLQKGQKVLDVMCGYGRHSVELARRGYEVTAVDNLRDYINEIAQTAEKESLPISSLCSPLLDVTLTGVYDAVICMGNSFAFFDEKDALSILQNLAKHLKKGGKLIINTYMLGEIVYKHFREKDWFYTGDYKYLVDNKFFFSPARVESEHIIIRSDGATERIEAVDYIFTLSELSTLVQQAGFALSAAYSTPRKRPFQLGDSRAYIVFQKS